MSIREYLKKRQGMVDRELGNLMPDPVNVLSKKIYQAMNYALKGGKRIRPILCLACAESTGANIKKALKAACAIEMVHTYSLIHDDLPCMDDDDYRRGRLTIHKKFGYANAVLAGDALLTEAFNVLAQATLFDNTNIELIKILSGAAGISGMIAGQAADISTHTKDLATQEYISIHKTGALIAASCKMGAVAARAREKDKKAVHRFGEYIGLVFQLTDDIIDSEGSFSIAGRKKTFEYAKELTITAKKTIKHFGSKAKTLYEIADFILKRKI
jgi:geranylgeranyl diphosphate synthase, type II